MQAQKDISGYRVAKTRTVSHELFFVHKKLETVRATDTVKYLATVYVDHDGFRGDSSFAYHDSLTEDECLAKINAAKKRALLVNNQMYDLPAGGEYERKIGSNIDSYEPEKLGAMIADAVYAADTVEGGSINALEIFIYNDTLTVVNSRGVNKTQSINRVMIEAIPTFTDEKQSVELYEDYRFTEFDPEKITAEISEKMREVKDRLTAAKPKVPLNINVVLRPKEISSIIKELANDLNYTSIYRHTNLYKTGDDLQPGPDADKLTVTMKGRIKGSENSAYFDDDGLDLTDTVIIKDGVVCGNFGSSTFGQYLGVDKPTGKLPCAKVKPGTLDSIDGDYLECVSMSGIQLDLYNDYIGGEIRLAYYHCGNKITAVTGITMSGKLSQVLAKLRLSSKTDIFKAYEGPAYVVLKDMTVL